MTNETTDPDTWEKIGSVLRRVVWRRLPQSNKGGADDVGQADAVAPRCPAGIRTPDGGEVGALPEGTPSAPGIDLTGEETARDANQNEGAVSPAVTLSSSAFHEGTIPSQSRSPNISSKSGSLRVTKALQAPATPPTFSNALSGETEFTKARVWDARQAGPPIAPLHAQGGPADHFSPFSRRSAAW